MTVRKSLSEAAAEVLNASRAGAPKEPMHTEFPTKDGSELGSVVDLGGSTNVDPQGNKDVGSKATAAAPRATPPGAQPAADSKAPVQPKTPSTASATATSDQKAGEKVDLDGAEKTDNEDKLVKHNDGLDQPVTEEQIEAARKARWEEIRGKIASKGVQEDVNAMLSGQDLSEEFKQKVATVFEAAVLARAVEVAQDLETEILENAQAAIDEVRSELEEQIDSYLNYAVTQWVAQNEVAIESGLKTEIAEGFINSLRNVFVENYISVPEEAVDVVQEQHNEIEELTKKLNDSLNQNIELTKQLGEGKKKEILAKVCEGLTATQIEKVQTLAEGVEFSTEADYSKKLTVIRESYFKTEVKQDPQSKAVALVESEGPATVEVTEVSPEMQQYVRAIRRTQK